MGTYPWAHPLWWWHIHFDDDQLSLMSMRLYHQLSDISMGLYLCVYPLPPPSTLWHIRASILVSLGFSLSTQTAINSLSQTPPTLSLKHLPLSLSNTSHTHTNAGDIFKFGREWVWQGVACRRVACRRVAVRRVAWKAVPLRPASSMSSLIASSMSSPTLWPMSFPSMWYVSI